MPGLVEDFAARLGWTVAKVNVLVEGTHDVSLVNHAANLYRSAHGVDLLGTDLAIMPAGLGSDGGVEGINRRLPTLRQVAAADPDQSGKLRHRFMGLYDNDFAGRKAIAAISAYDATIKKFSEVFLLRPAMSLKGGADHRALQQRFERDNGLYKDLDWEIEDLVNPIFLDLFEGDYPTAVRSRSTCANLTHRNFTEQGKRDLVKYVIKHSNLDDLVDIIRLIRALRDYGHLRIDHIQI
jgi:hypothetical protein